MEALRFVELAILLLGGLSAFWLMRADARREPVRTPLRATLVLVALFYACYVAKLTLLPTIRFAGPSWMRTVYLTLLVLHAAVGPFATGYGIVRRRPRVIGGGWLLASAAGIVSAAMLYSFGRYAD